MNDSSSDTILIFLIATILANFLFFKSGSRT